MGFSREEFEKYAYNGTVSNSADESITKEDLDKKLRL